MRLKNIAILVLSLSMCFTAHVQNAVSEEEAVSVAITIAASQRNNNVVASVKTMTDCHNRPLLYEVIMSDSSVILLSGNKACTPLLGEYKYSGISVVDDFEMIPCGLKCLVNNYINEIQQCFDSAIPLEEKPNGICLLME